MQKLNQFVLVGEIVGGKPEKTFDGGSRVKEVHIKMADTGEYTQIIPVNFWSKGIDKLVESGVKKGEMVEVKIDLRSNTHNDKMYPQIVAWDISKFTGEIPTQPKAEEAPVVEQAETDLDF